ncbi:hypothetical protein J6590_089545 [Homalodisca vitripennis]|nr:hypothetical protein J6590_089545 [Homalodisca vitripennis]
MVAKSENAKKRLFKMIESQTKEKNKVKKQKCVPKNKMKVESESEEKNDALCLICLDSFSESKPECSNESPEQRAESYLICLSYR